VNKTFTSNNGHKKRIKLLSIYEEDLIESFIHSGGPGGQKVNKSASSVHLKHTPTSIQIKCQQTRSQGLNRYYARKRLCVALENSSTSEGGILNKDQLKCKKQKNRRKRRSTKKLQKKG